MSQLGPGGAPGTRRAQVYSVIFGHWTPLGKLFDVGLILAILTSVVVVMLDSVQTIQQGWGWMFRLLEWNFTLLFTAEYVLRLWCVDRPRRYALSFFGIVDLLAVLPTYVSLLLPGGQFLTVIRILRVIRVFRVLKLAQYLGEARALGTALRAARYKITVFLVSVISIVVVVGSVLYLVEGPAAGFTSIPRGVYWAVVTLTTVGYGDIAPVTPVGQALASMVMILGYGIIAVPTGIVTAELTVQASRAERPASAPGHCVRCEHEESDPRASFCRLCGEPLDWEEAGEGGAVPRQRTGGSESPSSG